MCYLSPFYLSYDMSENYKCVRKYNTLAPDGVVQWIKCWPVNQ